MKNIIQFAIIGIVGLLANTFILRAQIPKFAETKNIHAISGADVLKLQQLSTPNNQKGANCFAGYFNGNATGRNDKNSYMMSYLATAVYANKLLEIESPSTPIAQLETKERELQNDGEKFFTKFKQIVTPYFSETSAYTGSDMRYFEDTRDFEGYDPEAIIIPSGNNIFITFRGTDRVRQRTNSGALTEPKYSVTEWLQTDFYALQYKSPPINNRSMQGKVHEGMWRSLLKIADTMVRRIQQLDGANKKIWITGHSLGAGQAQLFAYYIANFYNIIPQGVYVYAPPQIGDETFNRDLINKIGGKEKLQRFEFIDDPICVIAQLVGFKPAGTRVQYKDAISNEIYNAPERTAAEITWIAGSVPAAATTSIANMFVKGPFAIGGMCFHHENFYMQSAYAQLTADQKNMVPNPLPMPNTSYSACSSGIDIRRAKGEDLTEATLDAALDIAKDIIKTTGNVIANITGNALKTGTGLYKITCQKDGKLLTLIGSRDENGKQAGLWTEDNGPNMRFYVEKMGAGYVIRRKESDRVLDVSGSSKDNGARVILYDKKIATLPFQNNQIWYFYPAGGNCYVLQNENSHKVLNANNETTNTNGCEVTQNDFISGAKNQIWKFEKVSR